MNQTGKTGQAAAKRGEFRAMAFLLTNCCLWAMIAVPAMFVRIGLGQCQYEITAIIQAPPCPFTGPQNTFVRGMNSKGWVAGYYWDCEFSSINHAFVWKPGEGMTTLPNPPDVVSAFASGVNDDGWVIGGHTFIGVGTQAFVFNPDTEEYTYLEPLHPGISATTVSAANAINNNLVIVGSRVISKPGEPVVSNAVVWDFKVGTILDLGVTNGPNSWATAINNSGVIVGNTGHSLLPEFLQAWALIEGRLTVLPVVPKGTSSYAASVDKDGVIAGGGSFGTVASQPAIWKNSSWQFLPLPRGSDKGGSAASNDVGQVVGRVLFPGSPSTIEHAALWQHGEVHLLMELAVAVPDNATLQRSIEINNSGAVLVRGLSGSKLVGFHLKPINRRPADLNGDCVTNVHDLLLLLNSWGPCASEHCPADVTGSGTVGVPDLLFLLSQWD